MLTHADSRENSPLAKHHPVLRSCHPATRIIRGVLCPAITPDETVDGFRDYCSEWSEWLSLVALGSPRILQQDSIDSYLSRYQVPNAEEAKTVDVAVIKWVGLIPAKWITHLLIQHMLVPPSSLARVFRVFLPLFETLSRTLGPWWRLLLDQRVGPLSAGGT